MADIVEMLDELTLTYMGDMMHSTSIVASPVKVGMIAEAKSEIERLRAELAEAKAENARLLEVAGKIVTVGDVLNEGNSILATAMMAEAVIGARAALGGDNG
jgi:hypothetical protein